jgi:DNA-binding beta-propeller fold protein YncE
MSKLRFLRASCLAALVLAALPAQSLDHSITLADADPGSPDNGFGIALSADGVHAYATIAGDVFGPNNDDVARIDVIAGTQLGTAQAQLFPEDVAITYDPTGAPRHVYVANSTSGSVSCFTPALVPVATIPLPTCFGFSSYPFGVLAAPSQARIYVTSIGGCGDVFVIDSDPASGTFNAVLTTITVPNGGGRAAWWTYPLLVVPTTTYDAGFTLSRGGFAVVDVQNPANQTGWIVSAAIPNHYASTVECVVVPGGKVLLSIGNEVFPTVYECDLSTGAVTRTLDLNTITGIELHGLAINPAQTVGVVTSLNGGESVFFDLATFTVIGVHDHGSQSKPNDVVFTPDGSRAVVSLQGAARVDVLKDLPAYPLALAAPALVTVGGPLTFGIDNCESGQPCAIWFSLAGGGPIQAGPYTVYLSAPFDLAFEGVGDQSGDASVTFTVPNLPGLPGMTVYTQAVTIDRDGDIRLSNGKQTLIN